MVDVVAPRVEAGDRAVRLVPAQVLRRLGVEVIESKSLSRSQNGRG
jgi:hypothetical protein